MRLGLALLVAASWAVGACGGDATTVEDASIADAASDDGGPLDAGAGDTSPPPTCDAASRTGDPAGATGLLTPLGVDFNLRTPPTYDATRAHPLLVVYSPAGVTDPTQTEAFTGLTEPATGRGYVVAYVNHVRPNDGTRLRDAAEVAGLVAADWCVDESRIYFTGHSDGGSTATILAVNDVGLPPAAIAPSAAGVNADVLAMVDCPSTPLPVMVMHAADDTLFPGFGREAADWWAACNGCGALGAPRADGCAPYDDCTTATLYCEGSGGHGRWPPRDESIIDFFDDAR